MTFSRSLPTCIKRREKYKEMKEEHYVKHKKSNNNEVKQICNRPENIYGSILHRDTVAAGKNSSAILHAFQQRLI